MSETEIQWTDVTWNPARGCSRVSEGCRNCYAERVAARFSGPGLPYEGLARRKETYVQVGGLNPSQAASRSVTREARWTGEVRLVPEKLAEPLRWRKPRRVFVNSMSDLFHEKLSNEEIAAVFGVMAAAPRHTFQVLTKRARRLPEWFAWAAKRGEQGARLFPDDPLDWRIRQMLHVEARRRGAKMDSDRHQNHGGPWPLANVHLGVSVEDQETADERIPHLLATPAAVRFVSYEPALSAVDFSAYLRSFDDGGHGPCRTCSLGGDHQCDPEDRPALDWIIMGGESGRGARPCAVEWLEDAIAQCRAAGVPWFTKQLGSYCVSTTRVMPPDLARNVMGRAPTREETAPDGNVWVWRARFKGDPKGSKILERDARSHRDLGLRLFPGDAIPTVPEDDEDCPF